LPWFTAAAALSQQLPRPELMICALLYSLGAHGIMTLNDFKSVAGDLALGIRSLPAQLGVARAARVACVVMALPQVAVVGLLIRWGQGAAAAAVAALLACQVALMLRFLRDPPNRAVGYSAVGVSLYVLGMLVCAFALRDLAS
jgi:chlorophyll synthase